jgi:hypothetical protein
MRCWVCVVKGLNEELLINYWRGFTDRRARNAMPAQSIKRSIMSFHSTYI